MNLLRIGKPVPEITEEFGISTSIHYHWPQDIRLIGPFGSGSLSPVTPVMEGELPRIFGPKEV